LARGDEISLTLSPGSKRAVYQELSAGKRPCDASRRVSLIRPRGFTGCLLRDQHEDGTVHGIAASQRVFLLAEYQLRTRCRRAFDISAQPLLTYLFLLPVQVNDQQ